MQTLLAAASYDWAVPPRADPMRSPPGEAFPPLRVPLALAIRRGEAGTVRGGLHSAGVLIDWRMNGRARRSPLFEVVVVLRPSGRWI